MGHRHYCEQGGHYWQCDGAAIRGADTEPSVCMCFDHDVPMEQGRPQRVRRATQPARIVTRVQNSPEGDIKVPRHDLPGAARRASSRHCVGVCLWCGHGYTKFNLEIQARHLNSCVEYQGPKLSLDDTPNSYLH